jgi:hypothetical protein
VGTTLALSKFLAKTAVTSDYSSGITELDRIHTEEGRSMRCVTVCRYLVVLMFTTMLTPGFLSLAGAADKVLTGDFDGDGKLDADDIDALTTLIRAAAYDEAFDLNSDSLLDQEDRRIWVEEIALTFFGDATLNGVFNTGDLVRVFQEGQYEDAIVGNSTWESGDWDGDGDFTSSDLVLSFQSGAFEGSPRLPPTLGPKSVPEPSSFLLLLLGGLTLRRTRRQR